MEEPVPFGVCSFIEFIVLWVVSYWYMADFDLPVTRGCSRDVECTIEFESSSDES